MIGWLTVKIMWLSGTAVQWGSTIKFLTKPLVSSSGAIIVTVLRYVPFPKCASNNYNATQTPHRYIHTCIITWWLNWLLVGCWSFISWQYLRSYQDRYRHVTVHNHGDFVNCSAALLADQATSTMTEYPTQLHYPDSEPTSPCPVLVMSSARLGSNKYQFLSHWVDSTRNQTPDLQHVKPPIWWPRPGGWKEIPTVSNAIAFKKNPDWQ